MGEALRVGVKKDALDLALGHGKKHRSERPIASPEHDGWLPVELPFFHLKHGAATSRRHHERRHAIRALERLGKVLHVAHPSSPQTAIGDDDDILREELDQLADVARGGGADEGLEQPPVLRP